MNDHVTRQEERKETYLSSKAGIDGEKIVKQGGGRGHNSWKGLFERHWVLIRQASPIAVASRQAPIKVLV